MMFHIAIESTIFNSIPNLRSQLLKGECDLFPNLVGKKGGHFSMKVLDDFIKEEVSHSSFTLTSNLNRSVLTLSSGERKKALLHHLISSKPDFLLIENPFDALDVASVQQLKSHLEELSKTISIVLVFNRKQDILSFIDTILVDNNKKALPVSKDVYLNEDKPIFNTVLEIAVPKSLKVFKDTPSELISFEKVNVSYDDRKILNDINWTIKKGEFWELRGENGSGKSTLLTMINGDNPKAYGQNIRIFEKQKGSGESVWDIKQKIGYFTPAMMDLFDGNHTVLNMVISGLKDSIGLYVQSTELEIHLANEWLQLINLSDKKAQKFRDLNENEKRLVLIARAMIKQPPLLILDEPTVGLNDENAFMFAQLINAIALNSDTAILYVSHRKEIGLAPSYVFQLQTSANGSVGTAHFNELAR